MMRCRLLVEQKAWFNKGVNVMNKEAKVVELNTEGKQDFSLKDLLVEKIEKIYD